MLFFLAVLFIFVKPLNAMNSVTPVQPTPPPIMAQSNVPADEQGKVANAITCTNAPHQFPVCVRHYFGN